jgi:hypothetical protein
MIEPELNKTNSATRDEDRLESNVPFMAWIQNGRIVV